MVKIGILPTGNRKIGPDGPFLLTLRKASNCCAAKLKSLIYPYNIKGAQPLPDGRKLKSSHALFYLRMANDVGQLAL